MAIVQFIPDQQPAEKLKAYSGCEIAEGPRHMAYRVRDNSYDQEFDGYRDVKLYRTYGGAISVGTNMSNDSVEVTLWSMDELRDMDTYFYAIDEDLVIGFQPREN